MGELRSLMARLWGVLLLSFGVFFIRVGGNWVLLPLVAREALGLGIGAIGMMLTLGAVANLVSLPLTTWMARRFGRRSVVIGSTLVNIVALALLAGATTVPAAWLSAMLLGAGSGMATPTLSAYVADAAPPGRIGAAMGLLRTVLDVAMISGPVILGALTDRLGWGYRGGLAAAILLIAVITALFVATARNLPAHRASAQIAKAKPGA
jgi:MFS family permease